jgi:hypothetical protein
MVTVLVAVLVLCLIIVVGVAASRRTPASDDHVDDFRRHLNALSPEARRSVADRPVTLTGIDDVVDRGDVEGNHGS